jgi:uncharacterized membrane protein
VLIDDTPRQFPAAAQQRYDSCARCYEAMERSHPMSEENAIKRWERLRFRHKHDHPPLINVNRKHDDSLSAGEKIADRFAAVMGSWRFIIIQSLILSGWIVVNVIAYIRHWDPYPFILLNLALSFQAAYAAPIIMMSQNRQADKDRLAAEQDYQVNMKAEHEVKAIMEHLEQQDEVMIDILRRLEAQHQVLLAHGPAPAQS